MRRRECGFTLIEVLVVMVIVAILAAVAIPNYTQYIQRGRRAEAKALLLQAAQWQERMRTQQNIYAAALPPSLQTVNINGQVAYNVAAAVANGGTTYTLTATRAGVMAADGCGDFTLDSLGVRGLVNNTLAMNDCWNR